MCSISETCLRFVRKQGDLFVYGDCKEGYGKATRGQRAVGLGSLLFLAAPLLIIGGLAWGAESAVHLAGRCCCYKQRQDLPAIAENTSEIVKTRSLPRLSLPTEVDAQPPQQLPSPPPVPPPPSPAVILPPLEEIEEPSEADKKAFDQLMNDSNGIIFNAYQANPELFKKCMPFEDYITIDSSLTDEQAREIFPFFISADMLTFTECEHLTGASLQYLPIQNNLKYLVTPNTMEYAHIAHLTKFNKLTDLTIPKIVEKSKLDGFTSLKDLVALDYLKMPFPINNIHKKDTYFPTDYLPATLRTLEILRGDIYDQDLLKYLNGESSSSLEKLTLYGIDTLTDKAFESLDNKTLQELNVDECSRISQAIKENLKHITTVTYKAPEYFVYDCNPGMKVTIEEMPELDDAVP